MLIKRNPPTRRVVATRNPERTRGRLLNAAFREVYKSGFQGTDIDTIIATAGVTKGALYHHFESKEALGYAIVEEVIAEITRDKWLLPLRASNKPIDTLIGIVQSTSQRPEDLRGGCPLNNLSQEMSPIDEGFRKRTAKVFGSWLIGIATALREGQKHNVVRGDVDPEETSTYLVATYEGYISLAKNSQNPEVLQSGTKRIMQYLESLRPRRKPKRTRNV
jgi:TetR/AcrR family transcriptional regulator, transcriptional repressor for nem operon